MKLDQILDENVMWTDELGRLVDKCINYHVNNAQDPVAHLLRNYAAPMLSHAHDHPTDIEDPDSFGMGVNMLRGSFPNPQLDTVKAAVEHLHQAIPTYHDKDVVAVQ